ncbi:MAG: HlyD family efflux transporter periplasmic adaptor subunit [Chloroflexi bacterium]|nr:HlyD family efflux transporter periplasmic adaptor subunit [Chloroflexota bacterium]
MSQSNSYMSRLSRKGLAVLALVALVAVAAALFATLRPGPATAELRPGETVVTVRSSTFATEVPVRGSLVFPITTELSFESPGTVGEVMVKAGQRVKKGQVLARLDPLAVAALRTKVAGDELTLNTAQADLDALLSSHPMATAQVESAVAEARIALDSARETFDEITTPDKGDLAAARSRLDDARKALDDLLDPESIEFAEAQRKVALALVELDDAREEFDDVKDGFTSEELDDARDAATFAETALENAERDLVLARITWPAAIEDTEDDFDDATDDYVEIYRKWLGITLTSEDLGSGPDELYESWGVDLDRLFDSKLRDNRVRVTNDDAGTAWNELTLWFWNNLHPASSSIQGACEEDENLGPNTCVQRVIDDAYDQFKDARDERDTTVNKAGIALAKARDAVTAAADALEDAQEDLEDFLDGPEASEFDDSQSRLAVARAELFDAQDDLDELLLNVATGEREEPSAALLKAQSDFENALEDLEELTVSPDPLQVARKRAALSLAEARVADGEVRLAAFEEGFRLQVQLAESKVELANAALGESREDFEGASLVAPFDGIVSVVNIEADDDVKDDTPAMDVVDPTVIDVEGVVDASQVELVRVGVAARVTMDSLAGTILSGNVISLADEPRTDRGVVSFPVTIRVEVPSGVEIPIELTAVSTVILPEQSGVLLVPSKALAHNSLADYPLVRVLRDGAVLEMPVLVGASNGQWTVVRSGLVEGDKVVVDSSAVAGLTGPGAPKESNSG